jgi:mRNA-degrading endonuclease HigB of HigAB toxin-antitoxin module
MHRRTLVSLCHIHDRTDVSIQTVKQLIASNVKDRIDGFKSVFGKLKNNFILQADIQIQILVSGVDYRLRDLCEYEHKYVLHTTRSIPSR